MTKIALIASQAEVDYLRSVRDMRKAGHDAYKKFKKAFFKAFKEVHGIKADSRIKIELDNADTLGRVRYCGNNNVVLVKAPE